MLKHNGLDVVIVRGTMPRKQGIWYEGACYHIMGDHRCINGILKTKNVLDKGYNSIYEQKDYEVFFASLLTIRERTPFALYVLCLMC